MLSVKEEYRCYPQESLFQEITIFVICIDNHRKQIKMSVILIAWTFKFSYTLCWVFTWLQKQSSLFWVVFLMIILCLYFLNSWSASFAWWKWARSKGLCKYLSSLYASMCSFRTVISMCKFWLCNRLPVWKNSGNFVIDVDKKRYDLNMLSQFSQ